MSECYTRIFLLSHMRAYTSLVGHILGSHPAINGYFELHISYHDPSSLDQQLEKFREHETVKVNSHYLFDKILHNDYQLQLERLDPDNIKILLSLRQPEQTLKSIVELFAKKDLNALYAVPTEAAKYYIERLEWLAEFCRKNGRGYDYYDAESVLSAPDVLLPALSSWLGLDSPLLEHYRLFSQTGVARMGDSSKRILSGQITKVKNDYSDISIPHDVLKRAEAVYQDCRQQVIENARDAVTQSSVY